MTRFLTVGELIDALSRYDYDMPTNVSLVEVEQEEGRQLDVDDWELVEVVYCR